MKKPPPNPYTREELNDLSQFLHREDLPVNDVKNAVATELTLIAGDTYIEDKKFSQISIRDVINSNAQQLEQEAKAYRRATKAIVAPITELPTLINDLDPLVQKIAAWRLKHGK